MWLAVVAALVGVAVGLALARLRRTESGTPPTIAHHVVADRIGEVLREAVGHLEIGVVVADPSGKVAYRNAAAQALAGTHLGVLVDDHVARFLDAARRGDRVARNVDLHGPPKMTVTIAAEPMPNGAAVATIQDVSERARIDAMRTDFVANISHELRTPVGAIAVLAEALLDEQDGEVVHRIASRIVDETYRAVQTIDDLLELSRIEVAPQGQEVVDLASVATSAVARGVAAAGRREVTVRTVDLPSDLRVRGDERQLLSAVGNLVENAVKYSEDGGAVELSIVVSPSFVEISVTDEGIGIPAKDLDRIFERFYRVDRARSRDTGGTGLGLAIVRHVATNHGGEVSVTSEEGEGSTFVLRLPVTRIVASAEASAESSAEPSVDAPPPSGEEHAAG